MASDVYEALAGFLIVFMLFFSVLGSDEPLYNNNDDIVILNASNFVQMVQNSESSWMVEFYNSWCGHCIKFAPIWKQLGTDIQEWSTVIRIGAIDCANKENGDVCRNYDIVGYPSFKVIPAHADKNMIGVKYEGERTQEKMRQHLVDYLEKNDTGIPKVKPKLRHLNDMNEIWKEVDSFTEHTVIIFEEPDSYTGREVILDVLKHKELLVHRMVKPDVLKYGISKFPSMHLIEKKTEEGKFTTLADHTDRKGFTRTLLALLGVQESESEDVEGGGGGQVPSSRKETAANGDMLEKYGGRVHMQDLLSALHYSLRQEVAGYKVIRDEALSALKKYTAVLVKYFPGENGVKMWLEKVDQWLQDQKQEVEAQTWLRKLEDVQSPVAFLPSEVRWTGCVGSDSKYRGYPCALWTLFHTLTVNAVLKNGHDSSFDPHEVLVAMRAYITNFFGCQECRENFYRGAVKIEKYVKTANDSIMFLWRSHNKANDHLAGDASEDPTHPKIQFPNVILCPACHKEGNGTHEMTWDQPKVLEFLIKMYSKENIVMDEVYEEDGGIEEEKDSVDDINPKFKNRLNTAEVNVEKVKRWKQRELDTRIRLTGEGGYGFSNVDLSLCIVFYVICTLIIILTCFHFTVHRKMRLNLCSKHIL